MPPDGVYVIDKPVNMTSQQAVSRLKRRVGARKAGHAGTLDPDATGVLVVGVGRATRLLGFIAGTDKGYDATIRLGLTTTTDDAAGEPVGDPVDATPLGDDAIAAAMTALTGAISQVPSAVSAIKVNGQRAYALVRVTRFELAERRDDAPFVDLDVTVSCSSGTYVRALARDLGAALDVGGHLTALRRTRVGTFTTADSVALDDAAPEHMLTMEAVAHRCFPAISVDAAGADDAAHGRALAIAVSDDVTAVFHDERFLALYRQDGDHGVPVAVFTDGGAS